MSGLGMWNGLNTSYRVHVPRHGLNWKFGVSFRTSHLLVVHDGLRGVIRSDPWQQPTRHLTILSSHPTVFRLR
jgi:hypothetical protein